MRLESGSIWISEPAATNGWPLAPVGTWISAIARAPSSSSMTYGTAYGWSRIFTRTRPFSIRAVGSSTSTSFRVAGSESMSVSLASASTTVEVSPGLGWATSSRATGALTYPLTGRMRTDARDGSNRPSLMP